MAEHGSDREGREERDPDDQGVPFDEDAAWKAIVAGYGEEPPDPPGARPFRPVEDLALLEKDPPAKEATGVKGAKGVSGTEDTADTAGTAGTADTEAAKDPEGAEAAEAAGSAGTEEPKPVRPLGGSVSFAPGIGPRDHSAPEASEDDFDEDDEGHFVPPEPPPLPAADTTARFAWLGVVGGPVLLLLAVLLGWEMTWWLTTAGIGGFLGGFVTLVTRMRTDEDDDEDPGRGAVV
ncbi:hypothetical protein OIB37_10580 [Streptomyces sp. NBC_00820]|uniref:hypothetical protein n=1 Tax=Streptomyces sp. NBC_00820 TaxID=2975842 RepID=UPI002ED4B7AE|nr:hypothetical protein OIB37_10580 [Streptomyces sp. NBC_00820]